MASSNVNLFTPGKIGDLNIKNRVVLSPMTRARAGDEMMANSRMAKYYKQRSSAGLLITEGAFISTQAIGWHQAPAIFRDKDVQAWKQVVDAVKENGSEIVCQLWHCGRVSHSDFWNGKQKPVAPSPIAIGTPIHTPKGKKNSEVPRALETEEIPGVVEDFVKAAQKAKKAGFSMVELNSANGYLLDDFLQEKTNKRTDKYGGSIEKRFQFLKEVVEGIASMSGYPMNRIGVHLSPNGNYNQMGSKNFREQFLYVAEQLGKMGIGYIHFVDGLAFGFHELGKPLLLSEVRKVFKGTIIANCGYIKETAMERVSAGDADFVAFGRSFISNPDLPIRFKDNHPLEPQPSTDTWYGPPKDKKGYIDFPPYDPSKATA